MFKILSKKSLFEKKLTFLDHFFKITVLSPIFISPKLAIFDDFEEKSWLKKYAELLHVLGRGAYKSPYLADISDICRYLSDIGHIGNLGSFTKAILLQKCSISLISPDIAIRSRSSRSDWLHRNDLLTDART